MPINYTMISVLDLLYTIYSVPGKNYVLASHTILKTGQCGAKDEKEGRYPLQEPKGILVVEGIPNAPSPLVLIRNY